MNAHDVAVDDGRERHVVEEFRARSPDGDGLELAVALVVEAVDLGDLSGLVVAADEANSVGVSCLVEEKKEQGFDGVVAAIDEVAHEDVGS